MNSNKKSEQSDKQRVKNIIAYSSLGMQVAVTVGVFAYVGRWLDDKYGTEKRWFTLLFVLSGVALSIYTVIRQLNQLNNTKNNDGR